METIADRNTNYRLADFDRLVNDEGEVVALIGTTAIDEPATMNPEADRELFGFEAGWSDDVEVETVFGDFEGELIELHKSVSLIIYNTKDLGI